MSDAKTLLTEIIAYFAGAKESPGDWWAHDDYFSSYALDHRARDGTIFWLDMQDDGTIRITWRPIGKPAVHMTFSAAVSRPPVPK